MIDELDKAIHCYEGGSPYASCGREFKQMAEWLKELKRLKEAEVAEVWVARDETDDFSRGLYLYATEPTRYKHLFKGSLFNLIRLPKELFPSLTFENNPQKVELRLIGK
jgi:hypothetical protein